MDPKCYQHRNFGVDTFEEAVSLIRSYEPPFRLDLIGVSILLPDGEEISDIEVARDAAIMTLMHNWMYHKEMLRDQLEALAADAEMEEDYA